MTPRGSLLHWLGALARNLLLGRHRDDDLRANVDAYVDLLTDEKIAAGQSPSAARRAALIETGSVDTVKERARGVRAGALVADVARDTRYALRMMRRDLGFTTVAVVTLALGIGANTAIFSVVNAVLLKPLPYPAADRIVVAWERNVAIGKERDPVAPRNYQDWRLENTTLDELGAYRFRGFTLDVGGEPEQLQALSLSSSVFRVLSANAAIGRVFTDEEERRGDRVVVLGHELWQRRFGGSAAVVGRSVAVNGAAFTILGVMPQGFQFPDGNPVDLYSPLTFTADELTGRRAHLLMVVGRLRNGVTVESATADLARVAARIAAADSTSNPDVTVAGAHAALVEEVRLGLVVLLATVGFVLLIACANVANLLMVRATARRREVVMRAALGAGRARLVRQLLTESVLLASIGAALGVVIAGVVVSGFTAFPLPNLPRADQIDIDGLVLLFVTVATVITGIIFGIIPALHAATPQLRDAVTGPTVTGRNRGRSALLVAEIALSLMLLAGAGLMIRSLTKIQTLDMGFDPTGVLTAQILLPPARYPIDPAQYRPLAPGARPSDGKPFMFFSQLEERLQTVAGIEAVGAVSALPLNPVGVDYDLPVVIEGKPQPRAGEEVQADFRVATAGYFRTLQIPLTQGREFNAFDGPDSTPVAIINTALAEQMFAGENPIGQRLRLYGRMREIVGVIGSVRHHGFSREPRPEMILPNRQFQVTSVTLVVRSRLDEAAVAAAVRRAVQSIDPQQPVYRIRPMEGLFADSIAQPRFTALLLGGFAALALVLAIVGVYGVMSYLVGQRAREIAVRMALGARRGEVIGMVARQSLTHAAIGILLGCAGALAGTRLMSGLLFGLTATDPVAFASAIAAVMVAALVATAIPALRAARTTPVTVLRGE